MTSFQIPVSPSRRAAARFVISVRRALQKALAEQKPRGGVTQSEIARILGVHRSVINREIQGYQDMTLGRVAEISWALGLEAKFELVTLQSRDRQNTRAKELILPGASPAPVLRGKVSETDMVSYAS